MMLSDEQAKSYRDFKTTNTCKNMCRDIMGMGLAGLMGTKSADEARAAQYDRDTAVQEYANDL